jgi:hypothetical protein
MRFTPQSGQSVRQPQLLQPCASIAVGFMDVIQTLVPNRHFLNNIVEPMGLRNFLI